MKQEAECFRVFPALVVDIERCLQPPPLCTACDVSVYIPASWDCVSSVSYMADQANDV